MTSGRRSIVRRRDGMRLVEVEVAVGNGDEVRSVWAGGLGSWEALLCGQGGQSGQGQGGGRVWWCARDESRPSLGTNDGDMREYKDARMGIVACRPLSGLWYYKSRSLKV